MLYLSPLGLEKYGWAKAAGKYGFETFWRHCGFALHDEDFDFAWPERVTSVDYPADEGNKVYTVRKP